MRNVVDVGVRMQGDQVIVDVTSTSAPRAERGMMTDYDHAPNSFELEKSVSVARDDVLVVCKKQDGLRPVSVASRL